jgi:predicted NUDIX family phosphoesterase
MGKEALAVSRDVLFANGTAFSGFVYVQNRDYLPTILTRGTYHPRGEALENNAALQQIIPYVWIINPSSRQVFAYRRAPNQKYAEARLRNKWSCGLGGHIDRDDSAEHNAVHTAMMRELMEEVKMSVYPTPKVLGFVKDDSDAVNSVHFGVVAVALTNNPVEKGDDEMAEGRFFPVDELEVLLSNPAVDVDTWTRISWPFVKNTFLAED